MKISKLLNAACLRLDEILDNSSEILHMNAFWDHKQKKAYERLSKDSGLLLDQQKSVGEDKFKDVSETDVKSKVTRAYVPGTWNVKYRYQ